MTYEIELNDFYCPITQEIFMEPVIAEDGFMYEREAIIRWFEDGNNTSPLTREVLPTKIVFVNIKIKLMISRLIEKYPELKEKQYRKIYTLKDLYENINLMTLENIKTIDIHDIQIFTDKFRKTPIFSDHEIVSEIVIRSINKNPKITQQNKFIHCLVKYSNLLVVQNYINILYESLSVPEVEKIINSLNKFGMNCLHIAFASNKPHIGFLLCDTHINTYVQDINGWTPLHYACKNIDDEILINIADELFIDLGDVPTKKGTYPIDLLLDFQKLKTFEFVLLNFGPFSDNICVKIFEKLYAMNKFEYIDIIFDSWDCDFEYLLNKLPNSVIRNKIKQRLIADSCDITDLRQKFKSKQDAQRWFDNPNNIYIGGRNKFFKQSPWHNPFGVRKFTDSGALKLYETYIINSPLLYKIQDLKGKNLGCFCNNTKSHANVIIKILCSDLEEIMTENMNEILNKTNKLKQKK